MIRAASLPAAAGLLVALACPPFDLWPLLLVAVGLLAVSLAEAPTARAAAGRGLVWALAAHLVALRFVVETVDRFTGAGAAGGAVALVVASFAASLPFALGGAVAWWARERARVPAPAALGIGLTAASLCPAIFGWTVAALLSTRLELVQLAEYGGQRGASFVLVTLVAGAALALRQQRLQVALACLAALLAVDRFGAWRMDDVAGRGGEQVRVALVSQATPARSAPDAEAKDVVLARLLRLSRAAEARRPDLVVWPEAAYPYPAIHDAPDISGTVSPVAGGARVPRLVGLTTHTFAPGARLYNSAVIVEPDGTLQPSYDKQRLLWFGETVPFGLYALFPNASRTTPGRGPRLQLLRRPGREPVRVGVLICYEDISGGVARRSARAGAQVLANVTNDAWFAGTSGPLFQARLATLRSIELRTDLVRAVNGGTSQWLDAAGRVRAARAGGRPGVLDAFPRLHDSGATLYARLGDWPLVALCLLLTALSSRRSPRSRTGRSAAG